MNLTMKPIDRKSQSRNTCYKNCLLKIKYYEWKELKQCCKWSKNLSLTLWKAPVYESLPITIWLFSLLSPFHLCTWNFILFCCLLLNVLWNTLSLVLCLLKVFNKLVVLIEKVLLLTNGMYFSVMLGSSFYKLNASWNILNFIVKENNYKASILCFEFYRGKFIFYWKHPISREYR